MSKSSTLSTGPDTKARVWMAYVLVHSYDASNWPGWTIIATEPHSPTDKRLAHTLVKPR